MATKPAEAAPPPPKSKKMLLILGILALVLVLAGAGAWVYVGQQRAAALDGDEEEFAAAPAPSGPPTYLPLDNMVVNLADPGGDRVVQIGITLELVDTKAGDRVKQYLPTIRSGILLLVSQRTSEELLQRAGKEKLAADILREATRPFGGAVEDAPEAAGAGQDGSANRRAVRAKPPSPETQPVKRVLFSSFIVQ